MQLQSLVREQYAVDEALNDCRKNGYLTDYVYREEFLTMVLEHWTVEQQLEDYARWAHEAREAREEAEAKALAEKLESARSLLQSGISIEDVTKHLKLSEELVQQLLID